MLPLHEIGRLRKTPPTLAVCSLISSASQATTSSGELLRDGVNDALLDGALRFLRLALEVDAGEIEQHLGLFLDYLALSNSCSEVLDEHVEDLFDRAVGEESLELVRVQRLLDEVQGSLVNVSLFARVKHVQEQGGLRLLVESHQVAVVIARELVRQDNQVLTLKLVKDRCGVFIRLKVR